MHAHAELPYVAFTAAFLVLVPLPWHWRARNVATLAMTAWLFVSNIVYGVDAVLWQGTILPKALAWCDITTRLIIGATIALPASCMCISIHLAQVASVTRVRNSPGEKRRRQIIEMVVCFGVPMLWMGLHYIVQGHRFDIIEDYGCRPSTYISIPAVFLIWVPPLIFSTITVIYSGIALVHFMRHRLAFARFLQNSNSGLTASRYLRLLAMAIIEIIITVVSTSFTLWFTTLSLRPWTNFADVHWNFSRIDGIPSVILSPFIANYYYATWYIIPVSSFIFFVFFAFGQEAMKEYGSCVAWINKLVPRCGRRATSGKKAPRPFMSLPSFHTNDGDSLCSPLPSYQAAIGSSPTTPVEKSTEKAIDFNSDFVARSLLGSDIQSPNLSPETDYADRISQYSISTPPSPSHTVATTRQSFCEPVSASVIVIPPPAHVYDVV